MAAVAPRGGSERPQAGVRLSARKLIIRADKSAPYGHVNKIIEYAGTAGIYKIEVGAAVPPKGS